MTSLLAEVNEYDDEIYLSFVPVSFNSNILHSAVLVPSAALPVASSLIALLLVPCLLFSFVSELLVFTSAMPQLNREFIGHLIKPENSPYPLSLSPNYLWILGEIFFASKGKVSETFFTLLLPIITWATRLQSSEPASGELLEEAGDMAPLLSRLMWHVEFAIRLANLFCLRLW